MEISGSNAGLRLQIRIDKKFKKWCRRGESNPRPRDYETLALPLSYAGIRQFFMLRIRLRRCQGVVLTDTMHAPPAKTLTTDLFKWELRLRVGRVLSEILRESVPRYLPTIGLLVL